MRPHKPLQLTLRKMIEGWPALPTAGRAAIIHSRLAAERQRWTDQVAGMGTLRSRYPGG